MRILVTGGTGYIGSHTAVQLVCAGHDVAIADNFSGSKPTVEERIAAITGAPVDLRHVDLTDLAQAHELFRGEDFDAVMHFAGLKAVGESVEQPLRYYSNNIGSTLSVLSAMKESGVRRLVFSPPPQPCTARTRRSRCAKTFPPQRPTLTGGAR